MHKHFRTAKERKQPHCNYCSSRTSPLFRSAASPARQHGEPQVLSRARPAPMDASGAAFLELSNGIRSRPAAEPARSRGWTLSSRSAAWLRAEPCARPGLPARSAAGRGTAGRHSGPSRPIPHGGGGSG